MEYYQRIQNRASETVAVINGHIPALAIGTVTAADLEADSLALDGLAQLRDDALAAYDLAANQEKISYRALRTMTLSLPKAAQGDLDDDIPAESSLLDLYSPVFAITPSTTEKALERGHKLVSALNKTNTYLAGLVPPRAPITAGGKGVADLENRMADQPGYEQAQEDRDADARTARSDLRVAATAVDRLNKRFYSRLLAEARDNPALTEALSQITTENDNQPGTLGILSVLQGGADDLFVLVAYQNGTYHAENDNTLEWTVGGTGTDFPNSTPADPSGNAIGPFAIGQTVMLRTRVTNANGTTTGSIRTLLLLEP